MGGPVFPYPHPGSQPDDGYETFLIWPHNASTIFFCLLFIGFVVVVGWWELRGDACLWCGRDYGVCPHTRDEYGE